ncbi:MAG TPA: GGDEF domain-containing protein [Gemmatimonadaceae bacterium]|nr:GGDEF domain-containing protein [Gemmatimonadaceae bacterium]
MRSPAALEHHGPVFWFVTGTALVALLGLIDYATGYELSFSLFYLLPVCLVAWYSARDLGLVISMLAAVAWLTADVAGGHTYTYPALHVWNTLIRLGFFVIVTLLLAALRQAHEAEHRLARTDGLTGLLNTRHFLELADTELSRARRYGFPFSLAYVDLDNFKSMNDRFGHAAGDELLAAVGRHLAESLRRTDVVARLGGDEFAILLPQTDAEPARVAITKLHETLTAEMARHDWPVAFSIGVMNFTTAPASVAEVIASADRLMYGVKAAGKGGVTFATRDA